MLATSDVPGGVVNILTGRVEELAPVLAAHMDVNALDVTGIGAGSRGEVAELQRFAADNIKRVFWPPDSALDWSADPGLSRLRAFVEIKTVWHPMGV